MNHLLKSAIGSTALRVSLIAIGYFAAQAEDGELPYFLAILLVLLFIGWQAERVSLKSWHAYMTEKENNRDG